MRTRKPNGYWTEERVREEAKKHGSKKALKNNSPSAYAEALRLKIIDSLYVNQRASWDEVSIREAALEYVTKIDFKRGYQAAYDAAKRRGLLDVLFNNPNHRYWSETDIRREALKYTSKTAFRQGCQRAYDAASRRGIIDALFDNQYRSWDEAAIRSAATGFRTKSSFRQAHARAYVLAVELGIIDDLGFEVGVTSDNDAIYIWRAVGQHYNGHPVYKIGVTSARLGTQRIEQVARDVGFEFELVCCEPVQCKATDLERKLHILGEDPKFIGFDGATEFRALSDSALYTAISMICEAM